jgi:hypothetical protein
MKNIIEYKTMWVSTVLNRIFDRKGCYRFIDVKPSDQEISNIKQDVGFTVAEDIELENPDEYQKFLIRAVKIREEQIAEFLSLPNVFGERLDQNMLLVKEELESVIKMLKFLAETF